MKLQFIFWKVKTDFLERYITLKKTMFKEILGREKSDRMK
jgi:hypothetical protein